MTETKLFGIFAHQAARRLGYDEEDARLLGYSTSLLYAIFKAKAQAKKEKAEKKKAVPKESKTLRFGGQEFQVIYGKGKKLKQSILGNEVHDADEYDSQIKAEFPDGWYDRLATDFDKYLAACDPAQVENGLFDLYKPWRDENTVGFNRVDLEKLVAWLGERVE
jgi:hypothetical protein